MNSFEAKQNRERLEQHDENVYFMLGRYNAMKESAEAIGDTKLVETYTEIVEMLEHVRDDESLRKIYGHAIKKSD